MYKFKVSQLSTGGFDNNFSYLICEEASGDIALVDPCGDLSVVQGELVKIKNPNPKAILLTHGHLDHVSGVKDVLDFFRAPIAAHPASGIPNASKLKDGEKIQLGKGFIEAIYAPGHTNDGIIYRLSDNSAIFTGDTLFIECIGYCEAEKMFETLKKIKKLPDSNIVYSGHNYGSVPFRSLGEEKIKNPYLQSDDLHEFKEILNML